MTKAYAILFLLLSLQSFGQNILKDAAAPEEKILKQLKADGAIKISLKGFGCNKTIPGYRICNADARIASLHKTLTDRDIELLSASENPTIKFVAFILFLKRHNTKNAAVARLNHILDTERFMLMSDACEPDVATSLSSFHYLCFHAVKGITRFFKPDFKLTEAEEETFNFRLGKQMEHYKTVVCP